MLKVIPRCALGLPRDQWQVMNDGAYHPYQPARAERDGWGRGAEGMLCHALVAHISLGLPEMIDSRQQSLIRTNYGEGQLVKIYVKFGKIGSFIVFSHKLMSKELVPSNNE